MDAKLTIVERALLANQFRILSILEPHSQAHPLNAVVFEKGATSMYALALKHILPEEDVPVSQTPEE